MLKKLLMIASIFFIGISIPLLRSDASEMPLPNRDIRDEFYLWEMKYSDGVYYLESNRLLNNSDGMSFEIMTNMWGSSYPDSIYNIESFIVKSYGLQRSRVDVYSSSTVVAKDTSFYFDYEAPEVQEVMFVFDADGNFHELDLGKGKYIQVVLILNPYLSELQRNRVLTVINNPDIYPDAIDFRVDAYFTPVIVDPNDPETVLPETLGTIYDTINRMGTVVTNVIGNKVMFEITYNGVYEIEYTFAPETDMTIFSESYETFYYTHEDHKYMVFNRGDENMFFSTNLKKQTFVPYTIWNMDTNELVSYNDFVVHVYTKNEASNNVFAYFYVDEFIINHLLMASITFEYKFNYLFKTGDFKTHSVILEADQEVFYEQGWQADALRFTVGATMVANMIPGLNFPALVIGSTVMLIINSTLDETPFTFGNVSEIQKITPTSELRTELNDAYKEYYPTFTTVDPSLSVFKLRLGQFNEPWTDSISIRRDTFNIIEFRYMTNGHVYTMKGDQYKINFNPGDLELPPAPTPVVPAEPFKIDAIHIVGVGLAVFVIGIFSYLVSTNNPGDDEDGKYHRKLPIDR